jgi:hypothetical protein
MITAIKAGALYALSVFLIGFVLGTIRVLLIVPRVGDTAAVVLETPLMLVASWFVCRWSVDRLDVRRSVDARSLMGGVAFVELSAAEFALGGLIFGKSLGEQLADFGSAAGAIGLAAQIGFAMFPLVQVWRR